MKAKGIATKISNAISHIIVRFFLPYYYHQIYCLVGIFIDILVHYECLTLNVNNEIKKKWNNLDKYSKLK